VHEIIGKPLQDDTQCSIVTSYNRAAQLTAINMRHFRPSHAHLFKIPKRISIPHVFNDDIPAAVKPNYSNIKHFN